MPEEMTPGTDTQTPDSPPEQIKTTVEEDGSVSIYDGTGEGEGGEEAASGEGSQDVQPPAVPEVPAYATELQTRLASLEGTLRALAQGIAAPRQSEAPKPPKPVDQIETIQDLMEHLDWRDSLRNQEASGQTNQIAMRLAEERARGSLNPQVMGAGMDYDSVVNKYIQPLMQANPAFAQLIAQQSDPAMAAYTIGVMQEISEKLGNDPIKVFKAIRGALSAEAKGQETVQKKIAEATKVASKKVFGNTSRPASGNRKVTNFFDMGEKEFQAIVDGLGG